MITYLLDTLVNSIKTSLINKLGLDPSTEVDLDDFPQLIDDIPILDSVEELTVTENGTYTGTEGVTYNPVNVNLPLGSKSVTANGTYTASDDSLQGYSSVTVDIDDTDLYRDTTDSTYESVKTLSNCGAFPMLSLKVEINAVQDLHGYDHPWVGGTGNNKCPEEWKVFGLKGLSSANNFDVQPETEYYYCSPAATQIYYRDADGNNVSGITNPVYMGANRTFTTPSGCYKILLVLSDYGTTYNNDIAINYPSNITTYSPYSNICPISGWDEANITVADDDTDPTVSNVYTIDLDGTRYGGTLDVVSGELVVDRASVDFGGLTWTYSSSSGRSLFISNDITDYKHTGSSDIPVNAICECFAIVPMGSVFVNGQMGMDGDTARNRTVICDNRYSNASDFKTAMNGVQLVYELATPITIQLTPTQVKSLLGSNNIWADTGDVGDVRYFKKVEL